MVNKYIYFNIYMRTKNKNKYISSKLKNRLKSKKDIRTIAKNKNAKNKNAKNKKGRKKNNIKTNNKRKKNPRSNNNMRTNKRRIKSKKHKTLSKKYKNNNYFNLSKMLVKFYGGNNRDEILDKFINKEELITSGLLYTFFDKLKNIFILVFDDFIKAVKNIYKQGDSTKKQKLTNSYGIFKLVFEFIKGLGDKNYEQYFEGKSLLNILDDDKVKNIIDKLNSDKTLHGKGAQWWQTDKKVKKFQRNEMDFQKLIDISELCINIKKKIIIMINIYLKSGFFKRSISEKDMKSSLEKFEEELKTKLDKNEDEDVYQLLCCCVVIRSFFESGGPIGDNLSNYINALDKSDKEKLIKLFIEILLNLCNIKSNDYIVYKKDKTNIINPESKTFLQNRSIDFENMDGKNLNNLALLERIELLKENAKLSYTDTDREEELEDPANMDEVDEVDGGAMYGGAASTRVPYQDDIDAITNVMNRVVGTFSVVDFNDLKKELQTLIPTINYDNLKNFLIKLKLAIDYKEKGSAIELLAVIEELREDLRDKCVDLNNLPSLNVILTELKKEHYKIQQYTSKEYSSKRAESYVTKQEGMEDQYYYMELINYFKEIIDNIIANKDILKYIFGKEQAYLHYMIWDHETHSELSGNLENINKIINDLIRHKNDFKLEKFEEYYYRVKGTYAFMDRYSSFREVSIPGKEQIIEKIPPVLAKLTYNTDGSIDHGITDSNLNIATILEKALKYLEGFVVKDSNIFLFIIYYIINKNIYKAEDGCVTNSLFDATPYMWKPECEPSKWGVENKIDASFIIYGILPLLFVTDDDITLERIADYLKILGFDKDLVNTSNRINYYNFILNQLRDDGFKNFYLDTIYPDDEIDEEILEEIHEEIEHVKNIIQENIVKESRGGYIEHYGGAGKNVSEREDILSDLDSEHLESAIEKLVEPLELEQLNYVLELVNNVKESDTTLRIQGSRADILKFFVEDGTVYNTFLKKYSKNSFNMLDSLNKFIQMFLKLTTFYGNMIKVYEIMPIFRGYIENSLTEDQEIKAFEITVEKKDIEIKKIVDEKTAILDSELREKIDTGVMADDEALAAVSEAKEAKDVEVKEIYEKTKSMVEIILKKNLLKKKTENSSSVKKEDSKLKKYINNVIDKLLNEKKDFKNKNKTLIRLDGFIRSNTPDKLKYCAIYYIYFLINGMIKKTENLKDNFNLKLTVYNIDDIKNVLVIIPTLEVGKYIESLIKIIEIKNTVDVTDIPKTINYLETLKELTKLKKLKELIDKYIFDFKIQFFEKTTDTYADELNEDGDLHFAKDNGIIELLAKEFKKIISVINELYFEYLKDTKSTDNTGLEDMLSKMETEIDGYSLDKKTELEKVYKTAITNKYIIGMLNKMGLSITLSSDDTSDDTIDGTKLLTGISDILLK